MRTAFAVIVILASAAIAVGGIAPAMTDVEDAAAERRATIAFVGEPIAVIEDLPDYVSNGTPYALSGWRSADSDGGTIENYTWKITVGSAIEYSWGISVTYTFSVISVYTIELTVTDNESKTGTDVEAVSTLPDSDEDGLPDWWEQKYFGNLIQGPLGDYDSDGYINSEELEAGTSPTVKDPGPGILSQIPIWGYGAIAAGVGAVVFVLLWPRIRKKQKQREKQKIQYALEIEKALEEEK